MANFGDVRIEVVRILRAAWEPLGSSRLGLSDHIVAPLLALATRSGGMASTEVLDMARYEGKCVCSVRGVRGTHQSVSQSVS